MATYFRLLDVTRQFLDENGDPYNGGKLYTYTAGTTTNKATYQDNAGGSAHANPIVLDSAGRVPAEVWGTTGDYKLKLDTSADVTVWTADDIAGINDSAAASASEWVTSALTPTFVDGTSFTVVGDQTTLLHPGRRLKIADSGGTLYGTIRTSTYSDPDTTLVVSPDAADTIDSGISSFSYGLISADNTSSPAAMHIIRAGTVSAAASLDITDLTSEYCMYRLVFSNLVPATDNVSLFLRLSTDNGSTFKSGASAYAWAVNAVAESGSSVHNGDTDDSEITLTTAVGLGTGTGETASGYIDIIDPTGADRTQIIAHLVHMSSGPSQRIMIAGGQYQTAGSTDAFQILTSSGNIASMTYTLIGYLNA